MKRAVVARANEKGAFDTTALWGLALATGITYASLVGIGISREEMRIRALVAETHDLLEGVRAWQADHAAPVSAYLDAVEVGWPDADPDPLDSTDYACRDALAVLAGDTDGDGVPDPGEPNYISARFASSAGALSDPRLSWVTRCDGGGGQQFRLQLTSFGADPACSSSPGDLAQECPGSDVARIVAASTGGQVLPEGTGTPSSFAAGNEYVDWTVWRGAAYPALNRLGELLVWRDYNEADSLGLERSTAATSGIQLGGWVDRSTTPEVQHFADSPAALARWITGVDRTNPAADVRPLSPATPNRLDARSFAVFNRAVRYDVFNGPENLFTVPSPSPCDGGAPPRWIASLESIRVTFGGVVDVDQPVIGAGSTNDIETLVPISWQVWDDGVGAVYSPEVIVGVFTVLPEFIDNISALPPADRGYCQPAVIHGEVDSADTSANIDVFALSDADPAPGTQIVRNCLQSDGFSPYTLQQTLPLVPRNHLAWAGDPLNPFPTVRLSVMAHCPSPGSDA
ncbi:MAG: hypothetical protein F4Y00_07885 [Bacteroidetes bacterium SB0662_bin_6]|nr:hypothetical protein [Bacteroidetes bacterium SB0662_bin_6]